MISLRGHRWISVLVLFAFLSGCSSTRVPILPGGLDIPEDEADDFHVLAVGDEVIVKMLDGSEARGSVTEISPNLIVLGHTGNFGYGETRVESQSIDSIVWVNGGSIWPGFIAIVVAGVALYFAALAGTLSHLN